MAVLCRKGCGFSGTPAQLFMCSTCFREYGGDRETARETASAELRDAVDKFDGGEESFARLSEAIAMGSAFEVDATLMGEAEGRQQDAKEKMNSQMQMTRGRLVYASDDKLFYLEGPEWRNGPDLPKSNGYGNVVAALQNRVYVFGGAQSPPGKYQVPALSDAWELDILADSPTWEKLPDLPTARMFLGAASLDGVIFVVGGETTLENKCRNGKIRGTSLGVVETFDPSSATWHTMPSMPTARQFMCVTACDGHIVAAGGMASKEEWGCSENTCNHLNVVEAFDVQARAWRALPPLPADRRGFGFVGAGQRLYTVGGYDYINGYDISVTTVEVFDFVTGSWQSTGDLLVPRHHAAVAASPGRIWVLGGSFSQINSIKSDKVEYFDIDSCTWMPGPPMPEADYKGRAVFLEGEVVVQLFAKEEVDTSIVVACTGLDGTERARLTLDRDLPAVDVRKICAKALNENNLRIVLPTGRTLRECRPDEPLAKLLQT